MQGWRKAYFGYFYDASATDPAKITAEARRAYAAAYAGDGALSAGFDRYRAFQRDAEENQRASEGPRVTNPLLYVRGDREPRRRHQDLHAGLRDAGVTHVEEAVAPGSGHFPQEETAEETWRLVADLAER